MATLTIALDSANTYTFKGWGTHTPLYEKGASLDNYVGSGAVSQATADQLYSDLSFFNWMRILLIGGEHYRESPTQKKNFPGGKQAAQMARMNRLSGPWRYIATPYGSHSAGVAGGDQRAVGWSSNASSSYALAKAAISFNAGAGDWQDWLDATADGISNLLNAGCNVEYVTTPNEVAVPAINNVAATWWSTYLTSTLYRSWVDKVWKGTGMSGGGIKDRFPWLRLIADDPLDATYQSDLAGDALGAEVTYYGLHNYVEGLATITAGRALTEFGWTSTNNPAFSADCKGAAHTAHDAIAFGRAPLALWWTSLRDITFKGLVSLWTTAYTARPLFDLTTSTGAIAATAYWWIMKPHLRACGRAECTAWYYTGSYGANANFDPATGVYLNAYRRSTDSKYCFVYANFSGGNRTDTLALTSGGVAISPDLSGTLRTYLPVAGSGNESSTSAASTTSGSYAFGTVANNTIILLEMS